MALKPGATTTLTSMVPDPYRTLGLSPRASDAELRAAYHRAVQRHHPDHNHGSATSTQRFEEVQEAYAQIRRERMSPPPGAGAGGAHDASGRGRARSSPPEPAVDARLADLERELREAHQARERARQAASEAITERERARQVASDAGADHERPERPSDEELGYVKTDDSFAKILADARTELFERLDEARRDDR